MKYIIEVFNLEIANNAAIFLQRHNINRSIEYFNKCLDEQDKGIRYTFVAFVDSNPAGMVHLLKNSLYPGFVQNNIPEINDLLVVKPYQRQGIGENLVRRCEATARENGYSRIGLGVGLYKDYGNAQRLYSNLGYKPDGNGLMYRNEPVSPGTSVFVDDDLLIYLVKEL